MKYIIVAASLLLSACDAIIAEPVYKVDSDICADFRATCINNHVYARVRTYGGTLYFPLFDTESTDPKLIRCRYEKNGFMIIEKPHALISPQE